MSLYHTPALRGLRKLLFPRRFDETVGLQHCKVFVFDDDVLISGANLSQVRTRDAVTFALIICTYIH